MKRLLRQPAELFFLLITITFFFLLRLPSLAEPYWYGDEGIYEAIGYALAHGRILYQGIWDNKPPLLYLLYAIADGDQFLTKLFSLIFGLAAVVVFFLLAEKLFQKRNALFFSTGFFALFFALPVLEGNIANAENFMLFPTILAAYLLYDPKTKYLTGKQFLIAGLLLGLSFLFKTVAVFDTAAFLLFLSYSLLPPFLTSLQKIQQLPTAIKKLFFLFRPFLIGFLTPLLLCCLYFFLRGAMSDFLSAVFSGNISYVNYENQLFIPQGLLIIKSILLLMFLLLLWMKKDRFSPNSLFILLWFGFALFSATFSQRPYTHYLLVLLPAFSLGVGSLLVYKRKQSGLILLSLLVVTFFLFKTFWYTTPQRTIGYYQNFVSFITQNKDLRDYQAFFDPHTPRDYDIVSYLKLHLQPSDTLFLWGNSAQIYALTHQIPPGRYTVAYHMTASQKALVESVKAVTQVKPSYIVIFPGVGYIPLYLASYRRAVTIEGVTIYERTI